MLVGLPPYSVCVGGFDITDAVEPARRRRRARCRPGRTIHLHVARRLDEVEFDVTEMAEGGPDALTWGDLCQARAASSGDDVAGLQRRPPRVQGVRQPKHGGDRVSEDLGRASRDDEIAVQLQGSADVVPIDPIPVLDGGPRTQPTSRPKSAVADHPFRSAPCGTRLPSNWMPTWQHTTALRTASKVTGLASGKASMKSNWAPTPMKQ